MEASVIFSIVLLLKSNSVVVGKWTEIYYALGIKSGIEILNLQRQAGNLTDFDLFKKMIDFWVNEQGKGATVPSLCQILRSIDLKLVAGKFVNELYALFIYIFPISTL